MTMNNEGPRHYHLQCESGALILTGSDATLTHGRPGPLGSHGSIDDRGRVGSTLAGVPPRGRDRDGELEVGERLVNCLNAGGASWRDVKLEPEGSHVDVSATDSGATLKIQVTLVANQSRWEILGRTHSVDEALDRVSVADELFDTISKKASAYAPRERSELELAVNVIRQPSHTFDAVIASLKDRYRTRFDAFSFRSIWIVGSRDDLVFRVDQ